MEGKQEGDRYGKNHNNRNIQRNINNDELLSEKTLYTWRKKAAIEIQFLVKTKKEFYELYLRNRN